MYYKYENEEIEASCLEDAVEYFRPKYSNFFVDDVEEYEDIDGIKFNICGHEWCRKRFINEKEGYNKWFCYECREAVRKSCKLTKEQKLKYSLKSNGGI